MSLRDTVPFSRIALLASLLKSPLVSPFTKGGQRGITDSPFSKGGKGGIMLVAKC